MPLDQEVIDTANTQLPDEASNGQPAVLQAPAAQPADTQPPANAEPNNPDAQPQDTPKKGGVQKRIDELTRERYEAQRQADHWRQQAEKAQQSQPAAAPKPAPNIADYQDLNQFLADRDAWVLEQAEQRFTQRTQEQTQQEKAEQSQHQQAIDRQARQEQFKAREIDASGRYQDYQQAVTTPHVQQTLAARPDIVETVIDSDHGPDIAYFLAKNPVKLQELALLTPLAAVREIGRIEQMFMANTTKQNTNAPAPVRTVGGKAEAARNPENMSMAEYRKWRSSQKS
jgi:hypothetical protein